MKKSMKPKVKITEEEKREKIRAAMIKKKDLEKKTLKIVEQLLEPGLSESFLIDSSSSLNQNFYADAVEERSLAGTNNDPIVKISIICLFSPQVSVDILYVTSQDQSCRTKGSITFLYEIRRSMIWRRDDCSAATLASLPAVSTNLSWRPRLSG